MRFRDRAEAGRRLAMLLRPYREEALQVFGLGGSGVRVGYEVARTLEAPLDIWVAQQVEAPAQPGLEVGAVSEGEGFFLDVDGVRAAAAPASELTRWMDGHAGEVALRAQRLRGIHSRWVPTGVTAVLVVDGIAAGDLRIHAALRGLRRQVPKRLLLAAPVGVAGELERLRVEADEVLCVQFSWELGSVAQAYEAFAPVQSSEVRQLLARARQWAPPPGEGVPEQGGGWM
ncbi:phosphoribosyltransferase family protein [Stigmatella sp. ncwal1]|uniref:Phosphoribosyltransferase family protein n=1 Tax=Stigmatella ashevillensis TaxID=2995309 RepID=A0ABT5DFK6_9BACT|nr:phosphoribosyltransferase family protein [Stigmatella ashevillena]MDC0712450.1 phosphoribosyltransferase family protein [Stigmatella ashevillena]